MHRAALLDPPRTPKSYDWPLMTASTLLLKNALLLCTMDTGTAPLDTGEEITNGGVFMRGGIIEQVGKSNDLPAHADRVIDLDGHIVIPGMVNTHHHLFQNLTRVVPAAQNAPLFGWLKTLYPIWQHLGPDHIYWSTALGLAELALSGCTTSSDHLYIYPNGSRLDDSLAAAQDIGMRFHGTRGSMSIGESQGGLPPDYLTEAEPAILADSQRLIETHHDAHRFAMTRVALAPCSPFSVSMDLMRETATMARSYGVGLHTHLAENSEDIDYSLASFGMRPAIMPKLLAGLAPMYGMHIVCNWTHLKLTFLPAQIPASHIALVPICGWLVALLQCDKCLMPV